MAKAKTKKTSAKSSGVMCGGPSAAEQKRWQAEDDLRTLQRAKEIESDRARVSAARKVANDQVKALNGIANGGKK